MRRRAKSAKIYRPKTWDAFLKSVDLAKKTLQVAPSEECFFRGHADWTWQLLPTLFRKARDKKLSGSQTLAVEGAIFWEFQARAQELHELGLTDWDYLFFMRHHGGVTRLLDWTETLGVAVYFALERHVNGEADQKASPCVWLLNPYALNAQDGAWRVRDLVSPRYLGYIAPDDETCESSGETYDYGDLVDQDLFHWTSPVAIYPIQRSNRVRAQRGWFTIHGTDMRPLEQQAPEVVAQVMVPKGAIPHALRFLEQSGINEYTIYCDLDHLASELLRKNGLKG